MKKRSLLLFSLLTVFLVSLSMVAFAASKDENPYKNRYVKAAQEIRKQGTAKIVFQFMTRENVPLPGVIMLYNTTKERGLEGVADEKGIVQFDVKNSELYYIHHVIYDKKILPVQGSAQVNNIDKLDVRKGTVLWNVIVKYGDQAFMSYRGN
ncbi:MAG: hypothetical protein IJ858_03055 [Acidaminococcaceae bacterium]|nr:hypothetical protein [Acidaminococcaceae bacterium]HBX75676.1 hypothetical protein [Acidaminococcaceae bacterium]